MYLECIQVYQNEIVLAQVFGSEEWVEKNVSSIREGMGRGEGEGEGVRERRKERD